MDVERIIDEIEQLQEMFEAPDIRPLSASDISAANRRHDEMLAHSPWFRLWQHFGVCCRDESSVIRVCVFESLVVSPSSGLLPKELVIPDIPVKLIGFGVHRAHVQY